MQLPSCYKNEAKKKKKGKETPQSAQALSPRYPHEKKKLTKCVGDLPSSLTTNVCRDILPSVISRAIRSLALGCSPDATPRFTMLSKRDRRDGLAPNSSYELGRGRGRRELAPSTSLWKRPRGVGGRCVDPLALLPPPPPPTAEPEPPEPTLLWMLRSRSTTESDRDSGEQNAFKELGEGSTYSPDTARGNGTAAANGGSPLLLSPPPPLPPFALLFSGLLRLGTYIPFLCPVIPPRALFRRSIMRLLLLLDCCARRPEPPPSMAESGLESRGSANRESLGASMGVSTLWRALCVGRRVARGDGCDHDDDNDDPRRLGGREDRAEGVDMVLRSSSSWPAGEALADAVKEDREGLLMAIGREGA